jgi:putative membrane protein
MLGARLLKAGAVAAAAGLVVLAGSAGAAQATTSAVSEQDRMFLMGAHQSNLAEIAAGKLAQSKSGSGQVRNLGAMLVADHTKLDATLRTVASAASVSLPTAPNAEQQAMQAKLTNASGDDFDAMFVAGQLKGHAKAMALGEKELKSGRDAAVMKAAEDSAPVIAAHHHKFMAAAEAMGLPNEVDTGLAASSTGSGNGLQAGLIGFGGILMIAGAVLVRRRGRLNP